MAELDGQIGGQVAGLNMVII